MKVLRQSAAAAGFAAALLMAGCAHHNQIATTSTSDVGTISSTQAAQAGVIPGPAKVDSDGNVYTSSAAPGSGASLNDGTNTNVNNVPTRSKSTVVVTQTPIEPAPLVVETLAPAPIIVETPAPAPIVVETPAATVVETPTMTSSSNVDDQTTTTTVKTHHRHRRMAKE
jgi:hypothetical protein